MESNIAGSVNNMREKARSTRSRTAHAAFMMFRNARFRDVDSIVAVRLNPYGCGSASGRPAQRCWRWVSDDWWLWTQTVADALMEL